MKIIFFGTSEFGIPALKALHSGPGVQSVVTTQERPKGRGLTLQPSPIKTCALELGIETLEPETPNSVDFMTQLKTRQPDLIVLAAYRFILTSELLAIPRLGAVNLHPSLLPRYRGAAPIQRAIMSGETETGLSIFLMNEKIDQGNVILQRAVTIGANETSGELSARLAELSAKLLMQALPQIEQGNYQALPQDPSLAGYARKIQKEERLIHWTAGAKVIHNLIRALSPAPAAYTFFRGRRLEVLGSEYVAAPGTPGQLRVENRTLVAGSIDGSVRLVKVKPEGGKLMSGLDLVNGQRIKSGESLSEAL